MKSLSKLIFISLLFLPSTVLGARYTGLINNCINHNVGAGGYQQTDCADFMPSQSFGIEISLDRTKLAIISDSVYDFNSIELIDIDGNVIYQDTNSYNAITYDQDTLDGVDDDDITATPDGLYFIEVYYTSYTSSKMYHSFYIKNGLFYNNLNELPTTVNNNSMDPIIPITFATLLFLLICGSIIWLINKFK